MTAKHKPTARKTEYERIADRHLPHGYTVEYRKSLSGTHFGSRNLIQAPRPTTPEALYVFLHECAHAYLHTGSGTHAAPRHVQEMEAAKMAEHGVAVPPAMAAREQKYVAQKIVQAERRGAKHIDPRAVEFAGEHLEVMRAKYIEVCGEAKKPQRKTLSGPTWGPRMLALLSKR